MNAKEARQKTNKSQKKGINTQRATVLSWIASASANGNSYVILDSPLIKLWEEDYKWFESLGYIVDRAQRNVFIGSTQNLAPYNYEGEGRVVIKYGKISW